MTAKKKEIQRGQSRRPGTQREDLQATQTIEKAYLPQKTKQTEMIEGKPAEAAAKLVEKLRFDARVL